MNDFTKIKLINSLIDVVARFYELKNGDKKEEAKHLKGFCEGMAYTLIALEYLSQDEVSTILKGLGKKREVASEVVEEQTVFQMKKETAALDNLDIPTFIRKK